MEQAGSLGGRRSVKSLLKTKSLGSAGFIAVLTFYVAWPLYAGHEIKSSLDGHNVERLNETIDFPSVRTSLRPTVAAKVDRVITDALRSAGTAGGALTDQLKASVTPRIVDGVLAGLVTPEMLIRIYASGKSFKEALDGLVIERASQAQVPGGLMILSQDQPAGTADTLEEIAGKHGVDLRKVLGGGATAGQGEAATESMDPLPAKSAAERPTYGFGNIKHFSLNGPLELSIGLVRDPNARRPELTATMAFVDGSWKLIGLVP